MSSYTNLENKKYPKCEKVRFKDIPRSQYFSIKSIESLEIANRLRPDIEIELNDFICLNCYKKAKRIKIQDSLINETTRDQLEILTNETCETVDQDTANTLDLNEKELNIENQNSESNIVSEKIETSNINSSNDSIILDLPKSYSSHKRCIICFKNNLYVKLYVVPSEARVQTMISKSIFIPDQCRTCHTHLQGNRFKKEALDLIVPFKNEVKMDSKSVKDLISSLIEAA